MIKKFVPNRNPNVNWGLVEEMFGPEERWMSNWKRCHYCGQEIYEYSFVSLCHEQRDTYRSHGATRTIVEIRFHTRCFAIVGGEDFDELLALDGKAPRDRFPPPNPPFGVNEQPWIREKWEKKNK